MYDRRPEDNTMKPPLVKATLPTIQRRQESVLSKRFAWIPTDFKVEEDGSVKALGYINNLFPGHTSLYRTIEKCISAFIPMWERVLSDVLQPLPLRIEGEYKTLENIDPRFPKEEDEPNEENMNPEDVEKDDGDEQWEDDEDYYDKVDKFWQEWEDKKYAVLPDVPETGYDGRIERRAMTVTLKDREIQVIVKLANIHLVCTRCPVCLCSST